VPASYPGVYVEEIRGTPRIEGVPTSVAAFIGCATQGARPQDANFVHCDRSTMSQADIDNGRLIVEIGVAPVPPAEFVLLRGSHKLAGKNGMP
jgi:phage tail sheath protein FI